MLIINQEKKQTRRNIEKQFIVNRYEYKENGPNQLNLANLNTQKKFLKKTKKICLRPKTEIGYFSPSSFLINQSRDKNKE